MPRKTARPALKVTDLGSSLLLTVYKVANMKRFRVATLLVDKSDRQAMFNGLAPIYARLRGKEQR